MPALGMPSGMPSRNLHVVQSPHLLRHRNKTLMALAIRDSRLVKNLRVIPSTRRERNGDIARKPSFLAS